MAGIKAELYEYQRTAAEFMKNTNRCGLFLDMGLGKSIDDETVIPTGDGDKKVKDIKIGDSLYDRHGLTTEVIAVYPHKNMRAFRVTLKDGRSFICCDEHLIPYYTCGDTKTIRNKTLGEMLDSYKTETDQGCTRFNYRIPHNKAVEFDNKHHLIPPYLLGILIGDHTIRRSTLSVFTDEISVANRVADAMHVPRSCVKRNLKGVSEYNITHDNVKIINRELKRLGLTGVPNGQKFIPEEYINDSIDNRMDLITGLMDTDGQVEVAYNLSIHYTYSTMSDTLAQNIKKVCLSLGFGVNVKRYVQNGRLQEISVRIYTPEKIVSTEEHLKRFTIGTYRSTHHIYTAIVDIEEVMPRNMTCFTVEGYEKLFLINDFIVTHNTLIALTALVELAEVGKLHGHTLVIAPKRIAMITWVDEIHKWAHTQNARYVVLAGLAKKKRDGLLDEIVGSPPTIYIINREIIPQLVNRFPGETFPFMNVIIDEAQSFKSHSSVGFKKLKSIAEYTHRWVELTGTPSPNGLMDIWALIYLIDGGARLGRNITAYRDGHFYPGRRTPEGYPYEWFLMDGHDEIIHNAVKDVAISMNKEDYLTMPGITYNTISLEMTKAERKVYNQLKKEMVLPLIDGDSIEASNAAVLSGALLQLANGAIYKDAEKKEIIELHRHKLNALEEIVDGSNQQPILCFYWFKHDVLRLTKKFKQGEMFTGEKEQLDRWNAKKIPLLFAQPQSAGHGLNFQHGGHILVFFCVPRSLELFQQSIARLYRNGQKEAVIIHYLRMKGTVEEDVIKSLQNKDFTQSALMDAVKVELENIDE